MKDFWLAGEFLAWLGLVVVLVLCLFRCDVEATVHRGVQPKSGAGGSCVFSGGTTLAGLDCTEDGYCLLCRNATENGPHLICHWVNAYRDCR